MDMKAAVNDTKVVNDTKAVIRAMIDDAHARIMLLQLQIRNTPDRRTDFTDALASQQYTLATLKQELRMRDTKGQYFRPRTLSR